MKPSEASKKLEFHSKQICHGCVHPSMVGWCENHCQLPKAFKMAISALKKQEQIVDFIESRKQLHSSPAWYEFAIVKELDEVKRYVEKMQAEEEL